MYEIYQRSKQQRVVPALVGFYPAFYSTADASIQDTRTHKIQSHPIPTHSNSKTVMKPVASAPASHEGFQGTRGDYRWEMGTWHRPPGLGMTHYRQRRPAAGVCAF